jgi:hypothetical protein
VPKQLSYARGRLIIVCSNKYTIDKDNIASSGQIGCQKKKKGMYVQEYSVHSNKAIHPVICEGWHFTHMSKALA